MKKNKRGGCGRKNEASIKLWCAWCPELGLLLETAHESRFGVRQNVRKQLYWTDERSWQEIAAEGQWHEVEVTANFALPQLSACVKHTSVS